MQICPTRPSTVRALPIALNPSFPIHAPYLDRLHYSRLHPADYLHYHHSWELGICLQGSGIFYIGSRVYHYAAGDVSIIEPGVVHIAQSDPESISGWKFLDIDIAGLLAVMSPECAELAQCAFTGIIHPDEQPDIAQLIMQILDEMRHEREYSQTLIRLKVAQIALLLQRLKGGRSSTSGEAGAMAEISPALLHIVNHYHEPIALGELAAMCSKSESSFRRTFAQAMNTSPFEYLYHVRIKAAMNLLKSTHLPVTEVASRVGYQSLSSFNRHFLRIAGMPPLACRKLKGMSEES